MHPNLNFCLRYSAAWMKATVWGDGGSYIGFVVDKSVWTSYPPTAQSVCLVGGCVDTASEDYMGESGCVQNKFHNTLPPLEKKETRLSPLRYEVELAGWWGGESVIWDWTFLWTEIAAEQEEQPLLILDRGGQIPLRIQSHFWNMATT